MIIAQNGNNLEPKTKLAPAVPRSRSQVGILTRHVYCTVYGMPQNFVKTGASMSQSVSLEIASTTA
jgi:hypothetical protein